MFFVLVGSRRDIHIKERFKSGKHHVSNRYALDVSKHPYQVLHRNKKKSIIKDPFE